MIVLRHRLSLAAGGNGDDLFAEPAGLLRGGGALLALESKRVLLLARDVVLARQVVRGLRHVQAAVRVEQRDHERVFHRRLAEAEALARAADDVRRLRHVLHAAGEHRLRFAQLDLLGGADDRLDAGAAEAVQREGRNLFGHAGLESDVTRSVDGVARGLQGVADDDVIHFLRRDAAARECFLGGDDAEVDGRDVAERAVIFGHRRACAVEDDDVFHWVSLGGQKAEGRRQKFCDLFLLILLPSSLCLSKTLSATSYRGSSRGRPSDRWSPR